MVTYYLAPSRLTLGDVALAFCAMADPRAGPKARPRTGSGRPPTTLLCPTKESRGWPAFAGHDTGEASSVKDIPHDT